MFSHLSQYLRKKLFKLFSVLKGIFHLKQLFGNQVMDLRFVPLGRTHQKYDISKHYFTFYIKSKNDIYKYLFYIIMLTALVLLPVMSLKIGVTNSELKHYDIAKKVFQYYSEDDIAIFQIPELPYQGQSIDNLLYAFEKFFHIENVFQFRHIVASLFGWLCILITGLFLLRLFSWRAAFFGIVCMFISPRFLGESFYNLVDIPLAFAYIWAIYNILILCLDMPRIRWSRIILLTLSIFLATTLSVIGYSLLFYLYFFVPLFFLIRNPIYLFFTKTYLFSLFKLIVIIVSVIVGVYVLSLLYLPVEMQVVVLKPVIAIEHLKILMGNNLHLFNGNFLLNNELPKTYLLQSMLTTIPLLILICFLLHFLMIKQILKKGSFFLLLLTSFPLYLPLITAIKTGIIPPHAWSMFQFLYPFIIVLSVSGLEMLLRFINDKYTNSVIFIGFIILSIMPIRHIINNHPLTYVYYNEITGGITHAYGKYEMDYDEVANKQAINRTQNYLKKYIETAQITDTVFVVTNGNRINELQYMVQNCFVRFLSIDDFQKLNHSQRVDFVLEYTSSFFSETYINQQDTILFTINADNKPVAQLKTNKYRNE
jgi:hypothetical protein